MLTNVAREMPPRIASPHAALKSRGPAVWGDVSGGSNSISSSLPRSVTVIVVVLLIVIVSSLLMLWVGVHRYESIDCPPARPLAIANGTAMGRIGHHFGLALLHRELPAASLGWPTASSNRSIARTGTRSKRPMRM